MVASSSTVEPGYNDIGLQDTPLITSDILWYQLILHFQITANKMQIFKFIYFYRRSTCSRRFLRPSSEAHNCTYIFRYCQPILLLAATVEKMELISTVGVSSIIV